jgi:hypothetical protein
VFAIYEPQYTDEGDEIFRAGQFVPAGDYIEIDGFRQVTLENPGRLPASLDGRRAFYRQYQRLWNNITPIRRVK